MNGKLRNGGNSEIRKIVTEDARNLGNKENEIRDKGKIKIGTMDMIEELREKGGMRKWMMVALLAIGSIGARAQTNSDRISIGFGALYERGLDMTVAYEHETKYHNAWEYFANGYIKWDECASCGHVCPDSFWRNYRSYGFGIAYKPCVTRGRNHHGNVRIGASAGSDTKDFLGGIHVGYEHNYALKGGWRLYWQVKSDVMIKGEDLFRTGVALGVKLPVK